MAAALVICALPVRAESAREAERPVRIEVAAQAISSFDLRDPSRVRFGALEFRGGLELSSSYREFGGFSAIRVDASGSRFLAVSDKGRWLRGRIVYDGDRPVRVVDGEMAPILGPDGRTLSEHRWRDTESLAEDDGTVYVGIERVNQILRFDYRRDGLRARGQPLTNLPPGIRTLKYNGGLECLTFAPKGTPLAGTLIAISEASHDEEGNIKGFLIGGPRPGDFSVKRTDEFDVTDCAILPRGDLLILERRASRLKGMGSRLRRVPLASVKPGALIDGPELMQADLGYQIDNLEGLSVHRSAAGDIVLTLISDDNFSIIQRTILLQFTLVEP